MKRSPPRCRDFPAALSPHRPDDYLSDKTDTLDLVRRRIRERALEPKDICRTIAGWRPEEHYWVTSGFYDCDISQRRAYQLAAAAGLRRTKSLPWSI